MFDIRRVNFPILLLSFLLSVLLWNHVKSVTEPISTTSGPSTFNVPLEVRNQPAGTVIVGDLQKTIIFRAFGTPEEQSKINIAYLKAFVDLSEKPADNRYLVRLETTSEYKVSWTPPNQRISITLDKEISRQINVDVEAIGSFKLQDYRYDGATSDPGTVTVSGASSLVNKVKRVRAYLNLTTLETSNSQSTKVEALDEKDSPVPHVSLSTDTVTVRAFVAPRPPKRSLLIQPVWNGTPEFGSTITDYQFTPAQVSVEGPADVLANLSVITTKPINIDGLRESTTVTVELDLPAGIRLTKPETISLKVFIKSSASPPPPSNP